MPCNGVNGSHDLIFSTFIFGTPCLWRWTSVGLDAVIQFELTYDAGTNTFTGFLFIVDGFIATFDDMDVSCSGGALSIPLTAPSSYDILNGCAGSVAVTVAK